MYDYIIIGGGIVGLSTGMALLNNNPNTKLLIIEKDDSWAKQQTGHNSGVIHSGIYYKPGSFKAKFAREGNLSMVEFCKRHGIEHDICGKVIVATHKEELPLLDNLYKRGLDNGLNISRISAGELREIEPHVRGIGAIRVPSAGIVNYKQVSETFAEIIQKQGGELMLNATARHITESGDQIVVETNRGVFTAKRMINCAGLHSDRIVRRTGIRSDMRIVPFRGEYFELVQEKRYLVKHLIYPVPNPSFPFLGVHFTRMIGGHVEAGPNAVLSFKREGYRKTDFSLQDCAETFTYPGFWKLAGKYWKEGMNEMIRSFSKKAFVHSLQQLIPEIEEKDLIEAPSGVRAQALKPDGSLVDDFHIVYGKNSIHVCNAPSPAATASIQIGKFISDKL
ncbi:L-2-hydroxyglutarate oxidase [Paenibacillus radicis (ex Xue et al. 2023)]|uniref:L-2-hydroxyglutarate oxidase n=1 Tax=Paenibacillus radicis (ex Xue et al. 2023) TaxID=2972489 RepID=A0ABT1YHN1_9BACL|nr:L-2-hydroxyglutarate oxidase [Paenibacillus radicis (ex Xue et al. 2023)]MCR8632710.1 L-2-hydroxyglutarate oxidase [Paenibacillus radicis (ex Xue et al. 2023)]